MDPLKVTEAQLAIGGAALGGSALAGGSGAALAGASTASGSNIARTNGSSGGFNPWNIVGPVIGAGADIWSANKYAQGQKEANEINLQSAREQMAFQERSIQQQENYQTEMSNTAHQREVADLKAAGLNPVLSANAGASTPVGASGSGAMADISNPNPDYRGIIPKGIDTAIKLAQMKKDFEEIDSRIRVNNASAANTNAEASIKRKGLWGRWFGSSVPTPTSAINSLIEGASSYSGKLIHEHEKAKDLRDIKFDIKRDNWKNP